MSKSNSGLYQGTTGSLAFFKGSSEYAYQDESTAAVWKHIESAQENYPGTILPKSFTVDVPITANTPDGKMWTHGNSTEHIYEAISSCKDNPRLKNSNPMLYTQFILYDYYKSLSKAVINEVKWGKMITYGNWGFVFSKPRNGQKYPVVKHAKFNGLH